ncbi:MAG: hypothetical protein H7256_02810 [Bdellovibrio sp.]|nr:hypothetical protein [Bdellovibrio sp.]
MIKSSLFRHIILFSISVFALNFSLVATAATTSIGPDEQVEKDLMLEELNIGADSAASSNALTSEIPSADLNQVLETQTAQPSFTNEDLRASANNSGYVIDERDYSPEPEVRYERVQDYSKPYKQRRGKHGFLFEVGIENIEPTEYYSLLSATDVNIKELVGGSSISLINVEVGYKYNFQLGAVYLMGSYAVGSASDTVTAVKNKLEVSRLNLSLGYAADMLFNEPWVVPYGQVGVHQFDVTETIGDASTSATTQPSLNFRAGLLFQLNWIEKGIDSSTHSEGLRSSGLENTFLDVYATWYEPSASAGTYVPNNPETHSADPDMRSEGTIGVALKMEF